MKTSVIIPSGRPHRLKPLLDRLASQDAAHFQIELIVVVAAGTFSGLDSSGHRLVTVDVLQPPGRMRNLGAAAATGDVLAFIDDDCLPPVNWLKQLQNVLLQVADRGAVGCRMVGLEKGFWSECADVSLFWSYMGHVPADANVGSAALMVRREAFMEVGGFDETLRASEDWDFCLRLRAKGWHCWFDPSVQVSHDHRRSGFRNMLRQAFDSGRLSGLIVQKRHPGFMTPVGKLSLAWGTPARYFWLILPLSLLNSVVQLLPLIRFRPRVVLFGPFVFGVRLAYHFGVWRHLSQVAVPVEA